MSKVRRSLFVGLGSSLLGVLVLVSLAALLGGCAVGPNYVKPQTPVAASFQSAQEPIYTSQNVQAEFWKQFGDPTLDQLVDDALDANHDLRIALGRLVEARAARHQALFDFGPTVTADGGYTKQAGDVVVVIPTVEETRVTPHAEAFQAVIWHCLVSHPSLQKNATKW